MQALLSYGRSIQDFKNKQPKQIFEQASSYPSFFDKHLVHPLRRIKVLHNDPNANIRAFYFQYLMLCFEIENPNYQFYISKIQKFLIDPNFTFLFLEDDDQLIFNDKQFKRFLFEFMEILDSNQYQSTEAALNAYNIADVVFVYFFRSLALYAEITTDFDTYIDKNVLFGFLLENFNIDAQIFQERCIKFIQAEVFVYEESPNQVYLVYKDIQATNSQSNNSKLSNSADHVRKLSQSLSQSKKEDKQQVHQNISMLEADLLNSQTNSLHQQNHVVPSTQKSGQSAALLVDSGFKKNKILDTEAAYKKFIQLEQKPSVLSKNDEGIDSHEQIQYSFKNSELQTDNLHPNNQNMDYSKDLYQNKNYVEKENDNYLYNQNANYHHQGIDKSKDSQDFNHKDEINSHMASITTGMGLDLKSNQYDIMGGITNKHQNNNNQDYKDLSSRDRTAYSYFDPPQTNLPLSSRNHSSTTVEPTIKNKYPNYAIKQNKNNYNNNKYGNYQSNFNDYGDYHYNQSINGLNMNMNNKFNQGTNHVEKDKYQFNKDYYQFTSFNYQENANNKHGEKSISINASLNSHAHVPPTRDIPSNSHSHHQASTNLNNQNLTTASNNNHYHNEYNSSNSNKYNYDGLSTVSQHTASKQSLTLSNNHQSTLTSKTQENKYSLNQKISRQSTLSFPKKQPSTISSPYPNLNLNQNENLKIKTNASPGSSQSCSYMTRQMRQDSIPTRQDKQRFREIISQKLSVSKQFTDSLTLMKMGQPYCSSIKKMKARSRQFRQSIINSFK